MSKDEDNAQLIYDCPLLAVGNDKNKILVNNSIHAANYPLSPNTNVNSLNIDSNDYLLCNSDASTVRLDSNPNNFLNNFRLEIEIKRNSITSPTYPNALDSVNSGALPPGLFSQREGNDFFIGYFTSAKTHLLSVTNSLVAAGNWYRLIYEINNNQCYFAIIDVATGSIVGEKTTAKSGTFTSYYSNIYVGTSHGWGNQRYLNGSLRNLKIWDYSL